MKKIISKFIFTAVICVCGCSMNVRSKLPINMKTKKQIYDEHFINNKNGKNFRQQGLRTYYEQDPESVFSYIRHSKNETRALFKRLPNPDLVLYVFPHVSNKEQIPVPGYTTLFPMYTEIHYAMPGEVQVKTPMRRLLQRRRLPVKTRLRIEQQQSEKKETDVIKTLFE